MDALHKNWGWFLALGVLMVILGVIVIGTPAVATLAVGLLLGWTLVIGGVVQIVHAFMAKQWRGFLFELLGGVLYLLVGLMLVYDPLGGALALTLLLAIFLVVQGVFQIRQQVGRAIGDRFAEQIVVGSTGPEELLDLRSQNRVATTKLGESGLYRSLVLELQEGIENSLDLVPALRVWVRWFWHREAQRYQTPSADILELFGVDKVEDQRLESLRLFQGREMATVLEEHIDRVAETVGQHLDLLR